ncbi:MAG: heavy metal-responsive transcriptional regulator [Ornithinimicrobium sp.]
MRIGEIAAASGVPAQTIRYYERRGLLPAPERGENGYRLYGDSTLTQVQFIRAAQAAGLTLVQIASILNLRRDGATPCTHVHSLLLAKLDDVRARQAKLATLEDELETLISRSSQLDPADCTDARICHIIEPNQ